MSAPRLIRAANLPGWDRSMAQTLEQFGHCDYAWEAAGEVMLPVSRKLVDVSTIRDLARLIYCHEASRTVLRLLERSEPQEPRAFAQLPSARAANTNRGQS